MRQFNLANLGGNLRFKALSVLANLDRLNDFLSEGLVAGLHVCEIRIGKHVAKQCQECMAHAMPEVDNQMGTPPWKRPPKTTWDLLSMIESITMGNS